MENQYRRIGKPTNSVIIFFEKKGSGPAGSVSSWTQEENKKTKIRETAELLGNLLKR